MPKFFNKLRTSKLPFLKNNFLIILLILLFLIPFYFILYKFYIPETNNFGCFDDCMNIGAAYFMHNGRQLYSQIFFNHQPLMTYISYLIQMTNPINIYELLLRHMQFTLLFGLIANFFIIKRFKWAGVGFVVVYELSKFYIFGYRFLGEGYVIYVMVYLGGLLWEKYNARKINSYEYIIAGIGTWFTLFTREPFSIAILFTYLLLLWKPTTIYKKVSIASFFLLSFITFLAQPIKEYIYSVTTVSQGPLSNELHSNLAGIGFLKIFFYPVFVVIGALGGKVNEFWILFVGIAIVFIILSIYMVLIRKKYRLILVIYLLLGFSNIRYLDFGHTFYGAFHVIPYYGMLIFFTFLMIFDQFNNYKKFTLVPLIVITGFLLVFLLQPNVFFKLNTDLNRDLLVNYGKTINIGGIVNTLSSPDNTFFMDRYKGDDSLILTYWQAKRTSPYKYSWYIYFAPLYKPYVDARAEMLNKYPPDFYYSEQIDPSLKNIYKSLTINNKPSKIYVRKDIYNQIPDDKWKAAEQFLITK